MKEPSPTPPAISGDRLLIRTVRNLYCLKPED